LRKYGALLWIHGALFGYIGLFGGNLGLSCGYIGLFDGTRGLFSDLSSNRGPPRKLLAGNILLFYRNMKLFCGKLRLF